VALAGLVLGLVLGLNYFVGLFDALEKKLYDFASTQTGRPHSQQIVVLDIDAQSIANMGRWPWSREVHAKALDMLAKAKPKAIGHTVFFTEPQTDKGLVYLRQLKDLTATLPAEDPLSARLSAFFSKAEHELNVDAQLAQSVKNAGKVLLPAAFRIPEIEGRVGEPLPDFMLNHVVVPDGLLKPPISDSAQVPLASLGSVAAGVGHLTQIRDPKDGVLRSDPLFIDYDGHWVPSLSLLVAAQALNLSIKDLRPVGDGVYQMGGIRLPLNDQGMLFPQFYPHNAFVKDSFFDFYSGKIAPEKYAGKVVLIGASAEGVGETFVTPSLSTTPAAVLLAHQVSSLLNGHSFSRPYWADAVTVLAMLGVMGVVTVALPRTRGAVAASIAGGVLVLLFIAEYLLITTRYLWVPLVLPMVTLFLGYAGLMTKRYLVTEAGKIQSDEKSAESFRQLGLSNQGQGRLDEAFDYFRRIPLSDMVMDNLMNLALDFERKRQFNKAQAVYEHMGTYNKNYKDLGMKLKRAKSLSETVMLGGGGSVSTLIIDGEVEKPTLGRYQLEKELGKGAMGVVYLGKDPKINRTVAIKTMALSQEFEGDELVEARERFFREAETAGRLQHPNIVTIFDAGEEHNLAYIAMEFLRGKDLLEFTKPGQLLPVALVVSITARVADALAYAHSLNVVHRDIKPANIMYERQADIVKVTDFGIARVTDSSKTKTGMVLGTPSFMSPEQIAGKRVDGRSDLYSLGVMLFQMLTGYLPFRGESMAELMFKIANEAAPDARSMRPELPAALAHVVGVALAKQAESRYQDGVQMALELRQSLMSETQAAQQALSTGVHTPLIPTATATAIPTTATPFVQTTHLAAAPPKPASPAEVKPRFDATVPDFQSIIIDAQSPPVTRPVGSFATTVILEPSPNTPNSDHTANHKGGSQHGV
jgi:serine/threonine-protein kinase